MSVYFHLDVVGKPFSKEVQNELNKRKSLHQIDYETEATFHRPDFKLKRITTSDSSG
jgi:hypothetical protein